MRKFKLGNLSNVTKLVEELGIQSLSEARAPTVTNSALLSPTVW